jgi:transcriptional regulator with XRE-family HTH domain
MSMEALATYLRTLRPGGKPTMRDIAERSGLSHAFLSKLEAGDYRTIGIETIRSLAKGYGVPVEKLLAVAGITEEQSLPDLGAYLRSKYGLTEEAIEEAKAFIAQMRKRHGKAKPKG